MGIPAGPRAEQQHPTKASAIQRPEVPGHRRSDLHRIEPGRQLWELRVLPGQGFPLREAALEQPLVRQPLNDAALHAGVVERKPHLTQLLEVQQRVLEPTERAAPGDRPLQQIPSSRVPHPVDEVLHIPVGLAGRDRLDADQPTIQPVFFLLIEGGRNGISKVRLRLTGLRVEPPGQDGARASWTGPRCSERDMMCCATYSASLPTPPTRAEVKL